MAINPIDLPTAAGVSYGRGDVRHFNEDDGMSVPALQNPTRQLAERDNLLALKVNEVVAVVNNKEQFVPLPILRTTITPGTEEVVTNFRIPVGYEARILNAAVASTPSSTDLTLKVLYSAAFGSTTGIELISTSDEFSSGTAFYNDGELIISIRNNGASTLEASASVTLTVRPIAERGSLLVGSVIQGQKGNRGEKGDPGDKGDPGTGAPSLAIVWRGTYSGATSYVPGDAVSYTSGLVTSSYLCKVATLGNDPTDTTYWDVLASGSAGTPLDPEGVWVSGTPYVEGQIVTYTTGGITSSYLCYVDNLTPFTTDPATDTTHWQVLASGAASAGGETPVYAYNTLTTCTYASTVTSAASGDYQAVGSSGTFNVDEYSIVNTVGTIKGLAWLFGSILINMPAGAVITITLPTSLLTSTQYQNWSGNDTLHIVAAPQGSRTAEGGTTVQTVNIAYPSTTTITITSLAAAAAHLNIYFYGMQRKT